MVIAMLLPSYMKALSISDELKEGNCSRPIGKYVFHFGKEESNEYRLDPVPSLYFDLNSGNYTSEKDAQGNSYEYFKLLEPVPQARSECTSACKVYLQKEADHGTTPQTIANGFDCATKFEDIEASPTNNYKLRFMFSEETLSFSPGGNAFTTYVCYVCKATPTDNKAAAVSTNVGIKKTEAIKIEVGNCADALPGPVATTTRQIKVYQDTTANSVFYFTADKWSGNIGCIKEYVILGGKSHSSGFKATTISRDTPKDCENQGIGLACLIFRISVETALSSQSLYVSIKLWDDSTVDVFSGQYQITIAAPATGTGCEDATLSCSRSTGYSVYNSRPTQDNPTYAIRTGTVISSDSSCAIEGYRVYADIEKKYLIQEDSFYTDAYGLKTTNALPSDHYMQVGDSMTISDKKLYERDYYIHAFNSAGATGYCLFRSYICGEETFETTDGYVSADKPYTYDLVLDTTSGSKYTITMNVDTAPFSDIYKRSGKTVCATIWYDNKRIDWRVYNSATSSFDITDSTDISYDIFAGEWKHPELYVSLETEQLLKTRLMLTTRGGLQAMAYFNFRIKGPGTLHLASATDNVLTVYNEIGTLGKLNTFVKGTVISQFKSTSIFSTWDSLVIGQVTSPGSSKSRAINAISITASDEDAFIKLNSKSGDLEINLSSLPTFQSSKTYAISAQTGDAENAFANPASAHANGYMMEICIPPYLSANMHVMKIILSYDSLSSGGDYIFQRNGVTITQKTGQTLTDINSAKFSQDFPTILFGAYDSSFISSQVEVKAEVPSNSDVDGKLDVTGTTSLHFTGLNSLIDTLTSDTKTLAETSYTVSILTKLKSSTNSVTKVDYSATKWQNCKFYQEMTLTLVSEVKALYYLTTKTDVVTAYNSAEGLTTTMTIAKDTILSKFTTVSAACDKKAMIDKGYTFTLTDQYSSSWNDPKLTSSKGIHNKSPFTNDPYQVEIDFSGNKHLVKSMILMKRTDGFKKSRIISYINIEYQVDGKTWLAYLSGANVNTGQIEADSASKQRTITFTQFYATKVRINFPRLGRNSDELHGRFELMIEDGCPDPLNTLVIGELNSLDKQVAITATKDELAFIYVDAKSGDLKVDFSQLPSFQIKRTYVVWAMTAGGRNTKDNVQAGDYASKLEICIPPYISSALDPIKMTLTYNTEESLVTYKYDKGSTSMTSGANQTYATLEKVTFSYTLPQVLYGANTQDFIKKSFQIVTTGQSEITKQVTIASDFSALTFTNMHTIANVLSSESYTHEKNYTLTLKTSLKPQIVIDNSLQAWTSCVHYTTLQFSIISTPAFLNEIYIASAKDSGVVATYNSFQKSKVNNTLTISESTILSRFTTSDASKPANAIMLAQIDSKGNLVDADIKNPSIENDFLKIKTDLVVDFSQVHSFEIAKRYAITTQTVTKENGINNSDMKHLNGYKMDLCIPPYFSTAFKELDISLSYVDSTVGYTYQNGSKTSYTAKNISSNDLNKQVLEYTLPTILFESKTNDSWIKSNIVVSIADIDSSISKYVSVSKLVLYVSSLNDLVNSITKDSQVTGGVSQFTIILKTQLPSSTIDGIDYSNSDWQSCVYYQSLSFSITSVKSITVVESPWFEAPTVNTSTNETVTKEEEKAEEAKEEIVSKNSTNKTESSNSTESNSTKEANKTSSSSNVTVVVTDDSAVRNKSSAVNETAEEEVIDTPPLEEDEVGVTIDLSMFEEEDEEEEEQVINSDGTVEPPKKKFEFKFPVRPAKEESKPLDFKCKAGTTGSLALIFNQELIPSNKFKRVKGRKLSRGFVENLSKVVEIKYNKAETMEDDPSKQQYSVNFNEISEDGKSMIFQLDFDDPMGVSNGDFRDQVSIAINKKHFAKLFVNKEGELIKFNKEQVDQLKYDVSLPLQAPPQNGEQFKSFEQQKSVATSQKNAGIITILVNYVLKAAFGQIWSAAYALQLITYLTLINIMYAQCTVDMFDTMISLAAFDIVPEEYYVPMQQYLLPFESDYGYSHGFIEIGYESGHMLESMFFVTFMVFLQFVYYIFFYGVYLFFKRIVPSATVQSYAKQQLVDRYSFFQRTLLGCALEIFVSGLIEIIMKQTVSFYEKVSYYFSISVFIAMFWFSAKISIVYKQHKYKMGDTERFPVFNNKWGVIWEEIRVQNDDSPYQLFFILRRLIFALIIVAIPSYTGWDTYIQYALVVQLNLFSVLYLGSHMPYEAPVRNKTEIFNEFINLMISGNFLISMKTMSENHQSMMYNIGLMSNYLLLSMIGVNLLFVIQGMIVDCRLRWLRKRNYHQEKARIKRLISVLKKKKEKGEVEKLEQQLMMVKEAEKKPDEEEEVDSRLIEEDLDEADKERPKKRRSNKKRLLKGPLPLPTIKEEDAEHQVSSRSNLPALLHYSARGSPLDQTESLQIDVVDGNRITGEGFAQNIAPFVSNPTYQRGDPSTRAHKRSKPVIIPEPTGSLRQNDRKASLFMPTKHYPYVRRKK